MLLVASCSKEDHCLQQMPNKNIDGESGASKKHPSKKFSLELQNPDGLELTLSKISLIIKNKDTGKVITHEAKNEAKPTIDLPLGVYDIKVQAVGTDKEGKEYQLNGMKQDFAFMGKEEPLVLTLLPEYKGAAFVIKELFYSGGQNHTSKKAHLSAHYVIITNNTDKVQYADSLVFAGTAANTAKPDNNYVKELPSVVPQFMFMIKGTGKSVPVQAGEDLVICMEARNHNADANNTPDLSKADFEWYEKHDGRVQLTDNPEVENMHILFKTSRTITALHMKGYTSFFIFKMPMGYEELMKEHSKEFTFPNPKTPPRMYPVIPDGWIMDGVDLYNSENIKLKALPTSIDKSHTFVSATLKGYTIQRKIHYKVGERKVYIDNNDSMNDFERDKASSLI